MLDVSDEDMQAQMILLFAVSSAKFLFLDGNHRIS